jgi:hypothetical protein
MHSGGSRGTTSRRYEESEDGEESDDAEPELRCRTPETEGHEPDKHTVAELSWKPAIEAAKRIGGP